MGGTQFKERVRRKILKDRGLVRTGKGHLVPAPTGAIRGDDDPNKTLAMRLI